MARIYIGNVKGPQGTKGDTGATGAPGTAATVNVGTVSTTAYGNPAQVTNSGTESAAVLDFVIPQGQPGEEVTDMSGLTLGTMTTQTAQFPTPQIGDNGATLWGKVVKYFSDLRTLIGTKLNTANVVNNFTTTESGYALDARAGKTLNDNLSLVTDEIPTSSINSKITVTSRYLRKRHYSCELLLEGTASEAIPAWENLVTQLPDGWKPYQSNGAFTINIGNAIYLGNMNSSGVINTPQAISSGQSIRFRAMYMARP